MNSNISAQRIEYLKALPALEAVRLLVEGDFGFGEDEYLVDVIVAKANVNCDEDTMWEILYTAMDEAIDPATVLGRLAQ